MKKALPQPIAEFNALFDLDLARHSSIEAQCAAIADDIAYNAHDLDDGLRAGLFDLDALRRGCRSSGELLGAVRERYPALDAVRTDA